MAEYQMHEIPGTSTSSSSTQLVVQQQQEARQRLLTRTDEGFTVTTATPIWTHYDPYHGANYSLEIPTVVASRSNRDRLYNSVESGTDDEDNSDILTVQGDPGDATLYRLLAPSLRPEWKLNYQDFSPDFNGYEDGYITCKQTFRDLINKANSWLKQNPQVKVKSCETITWTTNKPILVGDTETVVLDRCYCPIATEETYHMTGIRLWLVPSEYRIENGIECSYSTNFKPIAFRDFKPRDKDSLTDFLAEINSQLDYEWIRGDIVSINSLFVPDFPQWDSQRLVWRESQCRNGRSKMYLRIFYIEGKPTREVIGLHDITPELSQNNWESFSLLMKKATSWIRKETSTYVTNLQSVYVDRKTLDNNAKYSAENCCQSFRNFNTQQCFQLLRLYYLKRRDSLESHPTHHVINCMTFTPVQTTLGPNVEAEFERMKQTMSRISAWLELAGAAIRSAETFITPVVSSSANHNLPEMTFSTPIDNINSTRVHKYLMHIRVYLEGDFSDPDPLLLPPLPYSLTIALQTSIQEREYKKYYKQKKSRQKRRKITVLVFLVILLLAVGIILLDQLVFDIFRRFT